MHPPPVKPGTSIRFELEVKQYHRKTALPRSYMSILLVNINSEAYLCSKHAPRNPIDRT